MGLDTVQVVVVPPALFPVVSVKSFTVNAGDDPPPGANSLAVMLLGTTGVVDSMVTDSSPAWAAVLPAESTVICPDDACAAWTTPVVDTPATTTAPAIAPARNRVRIAKYLSPNSFRLPPESGRPTLPDGCHASPINS